jgi:cytochrome c556
MKKTFVATAVAFGVAAGIAADVSAQQRKPEDQIKMRKAAFTVLSWNFGTIGAMAKGQIPYDQAEAIRRAEAVAFASHLPWEAFGAGTESGGDTRALPEVWKQMDKFKAAGERLQGETAKLVQAAKSGDAGQLKSQFGATAKACSACHDDFRKK